MAPDDLRVRLTSHLLDRGLETIVRIHHGLLSLRRDKDWKKTHQYLIKRFAQMNVDTTLPDHEAEQIAFAELQRPWPRGFEELALLPIGEELMKDRERWPRRGLQDLDPGKRFVALVDPLDGTKLEAREIPTWCIALVIFERSPCRIIAAFVGQATGSIYWASETAVPPTDRESSSSTSVRTTRARAWRQTPKSDEPIKEGWLQHSPPEALRLQTESSPDGKRVIAFVAPSPKAFLLASRFVKAAQKADPDLVSRVYNMGGNPMLAKIADGTIDAVIGFGDVDSKGRATPQKPHDYVPGAWIAHQAGATALDMDTGLSLEFEPSLLSPDRQGRRYIVARSAGLASRCLSAVRAARLARG